MTIQDLFAKLSKPGQKRVSYGIWWALNKMNQCDTKSYCDNNWQIFSQWISYKNADFILPKLDGFKSLYNGYKCECIIDGNMVSVTYNTGMANGNVMVSVSVYDAEKEKPTQEKIQEQKIRRKIEDLNCEMYGKKLTHEERKNYMLAKLGAKEAEIAFKLIGY